MTDSRKSLNRREFLSYLSLGWVAFTAACAGLASLAFRYSYPNVNFDPEMEFLAGRPDDYEEGVDERWKNGFGVWIVKEEGRLFALSNICTHLGCVPLDQGLRCPSDSRYTAVRGFHHLERRYRI